MHMRRRQVATTSSAGPVRLISHLLVSSYTTYFLCEGNIPPRGRKSHYMLTALPTKDLSMQHHRTVKSKAFAQDAHC
jgi:hypothetical protein